MLHACCERRQMISGWHQSTYENSNQMTTSKVMKSTKPIPRGSIWWLSGIGSRSRQNESQQARFDDCPDLAQEVGKTSIRRLDLVTFWLWFQKSRKPIPGSSIWRLSGIGSRNRQNQSQDARFYDFLALDPEVDKKMFSWNFNDPEYRSLETLRIALGSGK